MVLVIDCQVAGISGDMLLCSLVDLGADQSRIISGVKMAESYLSGSKIKNIEFNKVKKNGIRATELFLDVDEPEIHTRRATEIKSCIERLASELNLSEKAKDFAVSSIDILMKAESQIHGETIESVHFHEAASIDTVIDIIGSSIALDDLGLFNEKIVTTPVAVGGGTVNFSHGTTSNPAGAILEIFKNSNISIRGGSVAEELTTPTGASMLVSLTNNCLEFYPSMKVSRISYGAGKKNFEQFSNVLKVVFGSTTTVFEDKVTVLETNIDDVSGEVVGHLIDTMIEKGALDVSVVSGITKKNRPNYQVSVICNDDKVDSLLETLVDETGTLGVRIHPTQRFVLARQVKTAKIVLSGQNFEVRYKVSELKGKKHFKIEFDDILKVSKQLGIPTRHAEELIRSKVQNTR